MSGNRRLVITVLLILLSLMPLHSYGDLVTGKVNSVCVNGSFKVINSQNKVVKKAVKTDAQGNFSVTLRPGVYEARCGDLRATIRSSSQPLSGQALNFK